MAVYSVKLAIGTLKGISVPMKAKVNLTIDPSLWQDFRVECVKRQLSASSEIEHFIRERVSSWQVEEPKRAKKK